MPSIFSFLLTGEMVNDTTMAGTSMLTNLSTRGFSENILNKIDFPSEKMGIPVEAGTITGKINQRLQPKPLSQQEYLLLQPVMTPNLQFSDQEQKKTSLFSVPGHGRYLWSGQKDSDREKNSSIWVSQQNLMQYRDYIILETNG